MIVNSSRPTNIGQRVPGSEVKKVAKRVERKSKKKPAVKQEEVIFPIVKEALASIEE